MRLRRMCEIKARSKKCHVDDETHKQYMKGGEGREWLEIALAEAIERLGTERNQHKKLRAEFAARVLVVRERMEMKEKETTGMWLTEDKMKKSGDYSPESIRSIIAYCSKFPQALVRQWKYNPNIREYFVETETKQTIKQSELRKQQEISDCGDP
ncbi:unnamed protein product [Cladocopium goreaui]|uniref:Uncharacterized protein n=1 Tax=Cladocopium goreaui TaxID=2562237 RepID=A0A9P1CBW2_9DINO|nr:unnamed protein product [Cladocopium goreaui]